MHRTQLLQLLSVYQKNHLQEQDCSARFIEFVQSQPDCFQRSLQQGHVTGSAWLVNRAGSHVLLTHHRKLDIWVQLGGHADGESDVRKVAFNEAYEESGLENLSTLDNAIFDLDIHLIPARKNEPAHYHYDVRFALQATGIENYQVSSESHDLAWVEIANINTKTQETSMLRMAQKWLTKQKMV